jgi:hypothetical protein
VHGQRLHAKKIKRKGGKDTEKNPEQIYQSCALIGGVVKFPLTWGINSISCPRT